MNCISRTQRKLGAFWGALTGDALGVPVEFLSREDVRKNPVHDMRGFGTHRQPPGTWSDDSSLLLCTVESLAHCGGLNVTDLGERFVRWESKGHWAAHGRVFDIGIATSHALSRLAMGTAPEQSGGSDEYSNGNGSLMRIIPIALWSDDLAPEDLAAMAHRASALTHRHPRSQMACGLYCLVVRELLGGAAPVAAFQAALRVFEAIYKQPPFLAERSHFKLLEAGQLGLCSENEIGSSGYVMHTLAASIWCLLTSRSFEETVLKAVNLGGDTDTTGTVAGGLAGACYGTEAIPSAWKGKLARHDEVASLFDRFLSRSATTLYRPVGPDELALIVASGYREFPPRLPDQPIFYPVLNEEYARQIARDWNVKASGAGYVARFQVASAFLEKYPEQVVGGAMHRELWIPAEDLPEFNRQISGLIGIIAEFHPDPEPPLASAH